MVALGRLTYLAQWLTFLAEAAGDVDIAGWQVPDFKEYFFWS